MALKAVVGDARWSCTIYAWHPQVGTSSVKTYIQRLAWRPNSNLTVQLHVWLLLVTCRRVDPMF